MKQKEIKKVQLFIDSGAFSAWSQGIKIELQDYIDFIKEHKDVISLYANLDDITDPEKTWANQRAMEKQGLTPLPCFHYGEPIKFLERYLSKYKYIALGGMVPLSTSPRVLVSWLDHLFGDYICGKDGLPKVKVHGFGMTNLDIMLRYPWYSVDSTAWVIAGRMGAVIVPKFRKGKFDYLQQPMKVFVSNRGAQEDGKHFSAFSPAEKEVFLTYAREHGYAVGESSFKDVSADYKLKEGEQWGDARGSAKTREVRKVEIVKVLGLSNDYKLRDELNVIYFRDLEKNFPKWPWKWSRPETSPEGFDL